MKKSLVALAALAVAGVASAQVTITGNVSFSYQSSLTGNHGIAMSDNSIFLGDTEDLGGGMKLAMSTGFDAGGRHYNGGGNFGQENSSLALSGGFGTLKLMSFESDGPFAAIEGLSGASLDVGLFDSGAVNNPKRYRNGVSYAAPTMAGFTPALTYVTLAGQFNSNTSLDAKTKVVPALTYSAGPLTAYIEDALFNASYNGTADDPVSQVSATVKYDFGVATVGAGYTKPSNDGAVYILGVNVPVGAVSLGLATSSYTPGGSSVYTAGTSTWTEASIGYALSKRTSLKASWGAVNDAAVAYANAAASGANTYALTGGLMQNCQYRVGLFHSF